MSRIGVAYPTSGLEALRGRWPDTLVTALYVKTDDLLREFPERVPARPWIGFRAEDQRRRTGDAGGDAGTGGSPARPAGCVTPAPTCGTCSPTCPGNRAPTSGRGRWPARCTG